MNGDSRHSDHPTDRLIRELIQTGRPVEAGEVERILERMASAPFDPRIIRTPARERGQHYCGRTVQPHDEAVVVHLVRRVLRDEQWADGTTSQEYLDDLRRSIRLEAQLALYHRRGGNVAATLTPTAHVVPAERRGPRSLPVLWVVYSADRGIIVTGYQASSRDEISIPEDTKWLQ